MAKKMWCDSGAARKPTAEEKKARQVAKFHEISEKYGLDKETALKYASELYNAHVGIVWALCGKPTQTDLFF